MVIHGAKRKTTGSRVAGFFPALLIVAAGLGCASTRSATPPPTTVEDLRALAIFNGTTGERTGWESLLRRVDSADTVVIGELHGHPVGLPFAALLFEECLERQPRAALALEFITRDQQHRLDEYLDGTMDLEGLQLALKDERGNTAVPHGPMIEAAREAGRAIYGANAARVYTTTAREKGYAALQELDAEEQLNFSLPPVMPSGGYRDRFFGLMGYDPDEVDGPESNEQTSVPFERPLPSKTMRAVFRSQSLWDSTMAATTVRALDEGHRPVFLVIGQFHCDRDGGTRQLLRFLKPSANHLVVSVSPTWSDELLESDRGKAEFVVYVGPFDDE